MDSVDNSGPQAESWPNLEHFSTIDLSVLSDSAFGVSEVSCSLILFAMASDLLQAGKKRKADVSLDCDPGAEAVPPGMCIGLMNLKAVSLCVFQDETCIAVDCCSVD